MSQVIYARVPDTLKAAVESHAADRGVTLANAVSDLLERGLAALAAAPSVAKTERQLDAALAKLNDRETALSAARSELSALQALTQGATREVGTCPSAGCGQPITGYDLLATGRCRSCGSPLSQLLEPGARVGDGGSPDGASRGLNERDFLLLLGAVGVVVGVAYLASQT